MIKKTKDRIESFMHKHYYLLFVICILLIALIIMIFVTYQKEKSLKTSFEFNKSLDKPIITINNNQIPLQEFAYYIMTIEKDINNKAYNYNPENMNSYWNLYINNTFIRNYAKDAALNAFIRDNIYNLEAIEHNYKLTTKDIEDTTKDASRIMEELTTYQMDATNFNVGKLLIVLNKVKLTEKYITALMKEGYTKEDLDTNGSYYKDISEKYNIQIMPIIEDLVFGTITIKNDIKE